jgi:hypothetical protein
MPSRRWTSTRDGRFWAVAAVLLFAPAAARAQLPENPLRPRTPTSVVTATISDDPATETAASFDIWDESAAEIRPITATQELPPSDPQSVVPRQLGQPNSILQKQPPSEAWPGGSPTHEAEHGSWVQPWFTHTDPNDPYRHVGVGRPLIGTSWLNRPWYVGAFLGGMLADDLINDEVEANNSYFIGGRLGWDFDHYWGLEGRYAFSRPQLTDPGGDTLDDPAREYFVDVSLAYYPWGDSQWRPFFSAGLGFQTFRFRDELGESVHQSLLSVPLGVGLKFFHSPNHTLRLEAYDNIAFGDGRLSTMQNFTLAAGVEFRFGGRPTSFFPWHGSTSYW